MVSFTGMHRAEHGGEPRVCSMVPVPDEAGEDARRCVRERTELISERIGLTSRIGAVWRH